MGITPSFFEKIEIYDFFCQRRAISIEAMEEAEPVGTLNTGIRLALSDLFVESTDFVIPVSDNIKEQMRVQRKHLFT